MTENVLLNRNLLFPLPAAPRTSSNTSKSQHHEKTIYRENYVSEQLRLQNQNVSFSVLLVRYIIYTQCYVNSDGNGTENAAGNNEQDIQ